jgi:membrane protease YdiL (CAAX protease family)
MAITPVARQHPALTFYTLVALISWGGLLLIVGGPGAIPATREDIDRLMFVVLVALFAGPSVAGVLTTLLATGTAGLRALLSRWLMWRVAVRWYVAALLPAPVLVAAVLLTLSLGSPAFTPGIVVTDDRLGLLIFGLGWALVGGGLLEETGWTGFAVPALRARHSATATGLIVGLLWGVWHFPIAIWTGASFSGGAWAPYLVGIVCFYLGALPAYRVLMVWVYDRTESVLIAALMHASLTASTVILQPPSTGVPFAVWNAALAAALWIVVAGVQLRFVARKYRVAGLVPSSFTAKPASSSRRRHSAGSCSG